MCYKLSFNISMEMSVYRFVTSNDLSVDLCGMCMTFMLFTSCALLIDVLILHFTKDFIKISIYLVILCVEVFLSCTDEFVMRRMESRKL